MYHALRSAFFLSVLVILGLVVSGCATRVIVEHNAQAGTCKSQVQGVFVAHGFAIPDACKE